MPDKTGVWSNNSGGIGKESPESKLLPFAFKDVGYETFGTGKLLGRGDNTIYDNYFGPEQRWSPLSKTMVEYSNEDVHTKGTENPMHEVEDNMGKKYVLPLNRMPSDRAPNSKKGESFDWGPWDVPESDFGDTQITDWAIDKLKFVSEKPFFLGVGFYRPHIPLWAPKKYFDRFSDSPGMLPEIMEDDLDDLSEVAREWALEPVTAGSHATTVKFNQWQAAVEAYLACITYVDNELGRLLDELDKSGAANNTIIILWSDHGWHLGEKEHWGKWTGWERSIRVPFIIVPPKISRDIFAAGASCGQPVSLVDIYPTLAELCGLELMEKLDGESLVPLLKEPGNSTGRKVITFFNPGNVSIRDQDWRYIRYVDGSEELYNMKNDPNEWYNLAEKEKYSSVVGQFRDNIPGD
jgi:arylsulfatase A-like enzyme